MVSLWGGLADDHTGRPWSEDTIAVVFSMSKGLTSTCVHHLVEHGAFDLDAPVARYWPEFAQAGKEAITTRMRLSHRAGLPYVDAQLTLEQALAWTPVVHALEQQAASAAEHSGAISPRRSPGRLGSIDRPASYHAMIASLPQDFLLVRALGAPSNLFHYNDMWNEPRLHACELPSSNSVARAASVARLYAALIGAVDGQRVLTPETVRGATLPLQLRSRSGISQTAYIEITVSMATCSCWRWRPERARALRAEIHP